SSGIERGRAHGDGRRQGESPHADRDARSHGGHPSGAISAPAGPYLKVRCGCDCQETFRNGGACLERGLPRLSGVKPSTKRRTLIVNGVLAVLLIAGIGGVVISLRGGSAAESTPPTARVTRGNVTATVSASGSVASARERSLGFGTTGTVEKIYVKAGDRVRKGQVLARLDDTAARESLEAAKASLEAAAAGDTSTAQGHAQYISARNAYRAAKRTLAGTVIKAPFAGIVTAVNGSEGGSASGGLSGAGGASTGSGGQQAGGASSGGGFIELADPNRLQIVGSFTESDVTK